MNMILLVMANEPRTAQFVNQGLHGLRIVVLRSFASLNSGVTLSGKRDHRG